MPVQVKNKRVNFDTNSKIHCWKINCLFNIVLCLEVEVLEFILWLMYFLFRVLYLPLVAILRCVYHRVIDKVFS